MKNFTLNLLRKSILLLVLPLFLTMVNAQTNITAGDSCEVAVPITAGFYFTDGPMTGEGFSNGCILSQSDLNADWFIYTATIDGYATVNSGVAPNDTTNNDLDTEVSIFSGTCDSLVCVGYDDDGGPAFFSEFTWPICIGEQYYIQWDDRWDDSAFAFTLAEFSATVACDSTPYDATIVPTFNGFNNTSWFAGVGSIGSNAYDWEIHHLGGIPGADAPYQSGTGFYPADLSVSGLASNTTYELYVRNNCTGCFGSLTSGWNSTIFTTSASSISGQYFIDENGNCDLDTNEVVLENRYVVLEDLSSGSTTVKVTDASGYFNFNVPLGSYVITPVAPNASWDILCSDTIVVSDTIAQPGRDLGIASSLLCPHMDIDITTSFLRCVGFFDNNNTFIVTYGNSGSVTALNASVEVTLEPHVSYVSSTIPFSSVNGSTYTFDVGDVPPFASEEFRVVVVLDCDSIAVGQNICTEAEVFPQTNCAPVNNVWDGSNLSLRGHCVGNDTVEFELRNEGSDMTGPSSIIAIEDDILTVMNDFTLASNQSEFFKFAANGSTFYMEADQRPGHPQPLYVSDFVEACGTNALGSFSTGFASIAPPPIPASPYLAVWCEEVVASYDPNDITVYPKGYGVEHLIEEDTDLRYRIRFQNSGTDTAFNVFVIDTLPKSLDLTTFKMTSASHYYEYQFFDNVLRVDFPGIFLVDSATNEPESHGFFTYEIDQIDDNAVGTIIPNEAFIYFDINPPIQTNRVFNTIGKDFINVNITSAVNAINDSKISVYPNPFTDFGTIDLGQNYEAMELEITDVQGRKIKAESYSDVTQIKLQRSDFGPAGTYFFSLKTNKSLIGFGTLLVH